MNLLGCICVYEFDFFHFFKYLIIQFGYRNFKDLLAAAGSFWMMVIKKW